MTRPRRSAQTLRGRHVVITGGARGIGLASAKLFAAAGAKVSIGDVDLPLAQQAVRELPIWAGHVDVRRRDSVEAFFESARTANGPIDVLVNNAGIMPTGHFHLADPQLDDAQIDINLRGVMHGCRAVLPDMLARGRGHIINVASLAGRFAVPGLAVYCATKFAVVGLTESLAAEYHASAVQFSAIMPSKVHTELAAGTDAADTGLPAATPEQIAEAIVATVHSPRLFVAVPRYMENASALYRLLPTRLTQLGRRLIQDDRILNKLDDEQRAPYERRIRQFTTTPAERTS